MKNLSCIAKNIVKSNAELFKNIIGAFIVKGCSMILSVFLLPAYIRFFGDQNILGVWYTILSVLNWVLMFDLGIGNGLRNKLPEKLAEGNVLESKRLVSSTYISTFILVVILGALGTSAIQLLNWNSILNIDPQILSIRTLKTAMQIAFLGLLIQFELKLISSVLYAIQKPALVNFLAFATNLIIFIVISVIPAKDPAQDIIAISYINLLAVNVPLLIASCVLFEGKYKDIRPSIFCFDLVNAKTVLKIGVTLLWLQLIFMVVSSTNEFLISAFCGPSYVVEYQIYFKIYNSVASICSLALLPIWSAVTKAQVERRYRWIKKTYLFLLVFAGAVFAVLLGMTTVIQPIVNIWLKDKAITIDNSIAFTFAVSSFIFVVHNVNTSVGNGMSFFKPQTVLMSLAAIVNIPLAWVLVKKTGSWTGIVLANIISLLPFEIAEPVYFLRYINKLVKGEE